MAGLPIAYLVVLVITGSVTTVNTKQSAKSIVSFVSIPATDA